MYPNIEEDNVELALVNKQIDELKNKIALRKMQAESVPQPKTQVGWASYIMNDDRGLLDKYQEAERAWYNKLKDQEQAKELANAQREQQAAYRMDENIKNRALALNNLRYAEAALKNDTSGNKLVKEGLERDVRNAKEELKYWNKAVGIDEVETTAGKTTVGESAKAAKTAEDNNKDDTTTAVDMADMDAYISGKKKFATIKEQVATIEKYKANPAYNVEGDYRDKVNSLEAVKSTEAIKKADEAYKTKLLKEYKALSSSRQREWKELNPDKAKLIGV